MSIVDCKPEDVLDAPEPLTADKQRDLTRKSMARREIYFGKHKGKTLGEIPEAYLRWIIAQPSLGGKSGRSFEKTKEHVRAYLDEFFPQAAPRSQEQPTQNKGGSPEAITLLTLILEELQAIRTHLENKES